MAASLFLVAMFAITSLSVVFLPPSWAVLSSSLIQQRQQQNHGKKAINITTTTTLNCQERSLLSPEPRPPPPRINTTLRRGYLTQHLYHKILKCGIPSSSQQQMVNNNSTQQRHMHPIMKNAKGVLDFTTFLTTDLKIIVMGDSVAMQISQSLEEVLGATPKNRHVYRYSFGPNEGLHISAPIRGGGVVAGWRLLGMLLRHNVHRKLPNVGPGWSRQDVYNVTHHVYNATTNDNYTSKGKQQQQKTETTTPTSRQQVVGSFDVLLFHIPIGWIQNYESINRDTLMETVLLAGELFGVETVVFNVPSFTNNIVTAQQLQSLRAVQNRVVQFANDFAVLLSASRNSNTTTTTVRHVLTLRMDRLMDETMEWNARLMGMRIPNATEITTLSTATTAKGTTTANAETDWRLVALGRPVRKGKTRFIHHVAQSCAALPIGAPTNNSTSNPSSKPPPPPPPTCTPNYFSLDGMHVCMETMGGRLFAGLGCVLGCVYNNNHDRNDTKSRNPASSLLAQEPCQQQQQQQQSSKSLFSTATLVHPNHHGEKDVLSCANACNDRYLSLRSVDNEVLDE
jgi:hypothetical protein